MLKLMQLWQFTRRVHVSWLIAIACTAFVVGVIVAQYSVAYPFATLGWLLCACVLLICSFVKPMLLLIPLVILSGLLAGIWRGAGTHSQLAVYTKLHGLTLNVTGVVADDPDIGKRGETLLRLSEIKIAGNDVGGSVWVSTYNNVAIKRSDVVTVEGKMSPGFGSFGAALYKATVQKVERADAGDIALIVRDEFADNVRTTIAEPQVSLGLGYLLGLRRALPPELDEALVIAGLTHIVVASGYNLTILVRLARRLFIKVSKYLAALSASTMILAFIAVTGMSPSMSRAGLVAGLSLAAWYYGRKFHPLVLLPLAAAVTVAVNPTYAWNDIGWQLSFAAFAGVMILAPLLQRYFYGDKKPGMLRQIFGETISATIVTMPILAVSFGQFSNVAILANIMILPLVPLAMLLTFIAGMAAWLVPAVATIVGIPAQLLLMYMTETAQYFAELPWALTKVTVQPWLAVVAYVVIGGVCLYLWRVTRYNLRQVNIVE